MTVGEGVVLNVGPLFDLALEIQVDRVSESNLPKVWTQVLLYHLQHDSLLPSTDYTHVCATRSRCTHSPLSEKITTLTQKRIRRCPTSCIFDLISLFSSQPDVFQS